MTHRILWELNRKQQIAAVAAILVVAFAAIGLWALVAFRASDCASQKTALYAKWNDSLPLLSVIFADGVNESAAAGLVRDYGLAIRQANISESHFSYIVNAPAGKAERISLACRLEQSPLVQLVALVRPLYKKGDAV